MSPDLTDDLPTFAWSDDERARMMVIVDGVGLVRDDWSAEMVRLIRMGCQKTNGADRRKRVLTLLAEAQNWRCCYCHVLMDNAGGGLKRATLEHILPKSMGGRRKMTNSAVACMKCNHQRGNAWWPVHRQVMAAFDQEP